MLPEGAATSQAMAHHAHLLPDSPRGFRPAPSWVLHAPTLGNTRTLATGCFNEVLKLSRGKEMIAL